MSDTESIAERRLRYYASRSRPPRRALFRASNFAPSNPSLSARNNRGIELQPISRPRTPRSTSVEPPISRPTSIDEAEAQVSSTVTDTRLQQSRTLYDSIKEGVSFVQGVSNVIGIPVSVVLAGLGLNKKDSAAEIKKQQHLDLEDLATCNEHRHEDEYRLSKTCKRVWKMGIDGINNATCYTKDIMESIAKGDMPEALRDTISSGQGHAARSLLPV